MLCIGNDQVIDIEYSVYNSSYVFCTNMFVWLSDIDLIMVKFQIQKCELLIDLATA